MDGTTTKKLSRFNDPLTRHCCKGQVCIQEVGLSPSNDRENCARISHELFRGKPFNLPWRVNLWVVIVAGVRQVPCKVVFGACGCFPFVN
jgi:hypothetical protein